MRWFEPSDFEAHAKLLARLHACGSVPDYERILESSYRNLIDFGSTVIDIGTHEGRHTEVFSGLVGPNGAVLAFEPLPYLARALEERCINHVRVFEFALSDFSGPSRFVHARGTPAESGLRERVYNLPQAADPVTIEVAVRKLDDFLPEISQPVSFIKMDIEGAEVSCLRGGTRTLARFRPFVSVEYGIGAYGAYGLTARSLHDAATAIGYQIGDMFGAVCPDLRTWERVCDLSYWDWFLVPRERMKVWRARCATTGH